jgi:putative spermidine/putrescine transport system permease protein
LLVLLPLWSSYLIRVYAWKLILAKEGILTYLLTHVGLQGWVEKILQLPGIGGPSLAVSNLGIFLVFLYVWLPYMILPIQAALERVPDSLPDSLIEASADLGAQGWQTFRHVTLPLALPGILAGSVFTFSLTLGDFVVPYSLGNSSYFIGQAVLAFQGTSGNIPLAAAFTVVPMGIMIVYLLVAKRLGAFESVS